jgi:hypothetical protein
VLVGAWDPEGGRHAAQGDDQPVIIERAFRHEDTLSLEVDRLHAVAPEAEGAAAAHIADGLDDVARLHE